MKTQILRTIAITTCFFITTVILSAQVGNDFLQSGTGKGVGSGSGLGVQLAAEVRQSVLYASGTKAMDDGSWGPALGMFDEAAKLSGPKAAGAMYWKAFCLNKLGRRQEATNAVADLKRAFPQSKWVKDGEALVIEMKGRSGQDVAPDAEQDEDLKIIALTHLMENDEERALPILLKFIQGNHSKKIQERALFLLAQSDSPKARALMADIATGKASPELQLKAIHNLGIEGTDANIKTLADIYSSSNDVAVKRAILDAFGIANEEDRLYDIAKKEKNPELLARAIHGLGISDAEQKLAQLYKEVTDSATRMKILEALMIADSEDTLAQIARTETDPEVRRKAIHMLGVSGGKKVAATLIAIYNNSSDYDTKRGVIDGLFVSDSAPALVELAKKETDPQLKRDLVQKLSLMDDKAARDYMIQILEKD